MIIEIRSLKQLQNIAEKIAKNLKGDEIFALVGDLGAGKTTFTKKLLRGAGVKKTITSPTFVLMIPYKKTKITFYHMDLYRITGYKEVQALGIEDLWGKKGNIFIIEWADKIKTKLPEKTILLKFKLDKLGRKLEIINAPKTLQKSITT